MINSIINNRNKVYPEFNREFFESVEDFTCIGKDSIGGKASGLAFIKNIIKSEVKSDQFPEMEINIPRLTVIGTSHFDSFMERNNLYDLALSGKTDERIGLAFQKADLPAEILGDLRALIQHIRVPLAIRSSSLLEDAMYEPFAGIYATKMIPNNQFDVDVRFQKLVEAIKFVYASTFFKAAKDYIKATTHKIENEKMAVIIQEVIGSRYNNRFYPTVSGVARSFNYYTFGNSKPEDGIVNVALGLGKQIVDGGLVWTYVPTSPDSVLPFADPTDMMQNTQTEFWSVNMGKIVNYDPTRESENLSKNSISDADYDDTLRYIASTYSSSSDRIVLGTGNPGPRILNFGPLLQLNKFKFNEVIQVLLKISEKVYENPVEIEFAITIQSPKNKVRFGFLQVRPMVASFGKVKISDREMIADNILVSSNKVMGNGIIKDIRDIIYVKPKTFDKSITAKIAHEIELLNKDLQELNLPYLLIGFGRWGSSEHWLGIPVDWGQISGAKVVVESTLPNINVELSQGSHFFHNLTSFNVNYFSVHHSSNHKIDWDWLEKQKVIKEMNLVKHIRLDSPLLIKVDGRTSKGVIIK